MEISFPAPPTPAGRPVSGCRHHLLSNQEKLFKPFPLKSEAKQFCFSPFRVWYFPSNCLCILTLSHQIKDLPSVFRFPCELFSSQAVIPINPHFQAHPLPAPCHDSFINPLANTPVPSWALLSPTHPTFAVKSITKLDPVKLKFHLRRPCAQPDPRHSVE